MKPEDPKWINWPFITLEAQAEGKPLKGLGFHVPSWVEKVQQRVLDDVYGRYLESLKRTSAYRAGFIVGWMERGSKDSELAVKNLEEKEKEFEKSLDANPRLKKLIEDNAIETEFTYGDDWDKALIEANLSEIKKEFGEEESDISEEEREDYLEGLSDGYKTTHHREKKYYRSTKKTDVFLMLWMLWPIYCLAISKTQVWNSLILFLGVDKVGDLEAFRQFCKDHKIRIGKRGRPPKIGRI